MKKYLLVFLIALSFAIIVNGFNLPRGPAFAIYALGIALGML